MPFFSKVFKSGSSKEPTASRLPKQNGAHTLEPAKPRWDDAWLRTSVDPEEVQELLRGCTQEIKARALDVPFLLLPFRPASDPSAAKAFIRNFFGDGRDPDRRPTGNQLLQEIRLVEPLVLCSVCKWCWARLAGGVVTWEAYELFTIGEKDSNQARDAFNTFIPISVASQAREKIIFDFFELLAAVAAHGKTNGLGGRKLSRLAGWWAFEHVDVTNGFESGYKSWAKAADATSHLFFAYLRSLAPSSAKERSGVTLLPRALEALLDATEYPPGTKASHQLQSSKVAMIVESVSPTPFALLSRAKDFRYRDEDDVLQRFSDFDDPSEALSDECRRVLRAISSANDTSSVKTSTSLKDPSWSRFEDIGFSTLAEDLEDIEQKDAPIIAMPALQPGLRSAPQSRVDLGRPTTPSWADFLSTGFVDEKQSNPAVLLPPDKVLPPLNMRAQSSQSQRRMTDDTSSLEPGELANITRVILDDAFWWAWITSLAGEEAPARKAVFGRCALIETRIYGSSWLVIEEIVKGAAPEPDAGAYVAEKKSRFTFGKKLSRSKSSAKGASLPRAAAASATNISTQRTNPSTQTSRNNIAPDQQARIQAAAAALQEKRREEAATARRGRMGDSVHQKTQSVATLQSNFIREAAPAMKWANSYDKNTIRAKYLGNEFTGRGSAMDLREVLGAGDATGARHAQTPEPSDPVNDPAKADAAERGKKPTMAAPPRDSSLQHESSDKNGGTSPQAANFFASQMPQAAQPTKDPKTKPSDQSSPSPASESRPPPPLKKDRVAATAIPGPAAPPKPTQQAVEQRAPPKQQAMQPNRDKALPNPVASGDPAQSASTRADLNATKTTEVSVTSETANKENQAPLQQARSKDSGEPGKAPMTPDQSNHATDPTSSPENSKSDRNKLRKNEKRVGKGIKGIFKMKKDDDQKETTKAPARSAPSNSSSVAAARAALEAKAREGQATSAAPSNRVTTKRYSTAGKNGVLEEAPPSKPVARAEPRASPRPGPRASPAPALLEQETGAPAPEKRVSAAESSQTDEAEEKRAQEAFGTFDQGGVEPDTPVHAEHPTDERSARPQTPDASVPATVATEQHEHQESSVAQEITEKAPISEPSEEPRPESKTSPVPGAFEQAPDPGDRWAQIRKNAAERAQRMSEEQSAARTEQTSRTDDDGETSGEETIESRVARIKARVAELTGNMDPPAYKP